jgi:tRNA (guanine37-N1)-methyltransferase
MLGSLKLILKIEKLKLEIMLSISVLTLFPELFEKYLQTSIIGRAVTNNLLNINVYNIRDYTTNKYMRVDDYIYGGGPGLLMQCQPIVDCLDKIKTNNSKVILLSPIGKTYNQEKAHELASEENIILICGHYEGIEARIENYIDEYISIGDYILTGGELPALSIIDSISRLIKGVINDESSIEESFETHRLEYPQYTNPRVYKDQEIPLILLSGNHEAIQKYHLKKSIELTIKYRPDLIDKFPLTDEENKALNLDDEYFNKVIQAAKIK